LRPYHLIHLCPTVRGWYIKNINIKCLPNMLFKDPGKTANRPDMYSVHCIEPIKGLVHTHQFLFENGYFFSSGLAYCPHVSGENGHRKRIFSKTLSRVEIFGNAGFSFTRGRTKTEVFNRDDLCSERDAIVFNIVSIFVWTGENDSLRMR